MKVTILLSGPYMIMRLLRRVSDSAGARGSVGVEAGGVFENVGQLVGERNGCEDFNAGSKAKQL